VDRAIKTDMGVFPVEELFEMLAQRMITIHARDHLHESGARCIVGHELFPKANAER
jgi:hypothetical protein